MPLTCRRPLGSAQQHSGQPDFGRVVCIHDARMIALHGFIKKTQNTPLRDLKLAKTRMKEVTRS